MGWNEFFRELMYDAPGFLWGEGATGDVLGGILGAGLASAGLHLSPQLLQGVGEFLRIAGRELTYGKATLPYWNRVALNLTDYLRALLACWTIPWSTLQLLLEKVALRVL